ncbi:MAG: VanW family protein [Desulfotomaculaceae bacterium]|nr:VanW family protein [Desulfotomaculaceae bacterium]
MNKTIFVVGGKDYIVNNSLYQMAEAPYLAGGRVLIPYKEAAAALGIDEKNILWDSQMKTIEIHSANSGLKFTVDEKVFYVNGEPQQMDVAPVSRDGQIFLPVKWPAEALGYAVAWEAKSLSILIGPPGELPLWKPLPTAELNDNVRALEFSGDSLYAINKISSSSIAFVGEYANVFNAGVAARYADGFILEANEVFSFDKVVGERSTKRGYIAGYDILDNLTIGGGVCRTSTLLYQAARGAGLEIIERHPHYLPVHYTPVGTDASVNWGTMDLRFRNNLNSSILIKAGLEERKEDRRLWTEFWENKPLPKVKVAVLRKEPGENYRDNLESVQLTAVIKDGTFYVSLEQLSDLLNLPLEIREIDGLQYAVLGLNNTQSVRCIANNNNAVVNNNEFQLASPPFWLPECNCKFWISLQDWAKIIGADVCWSGDTEPMALLNLSGEKYRIRQNVEDKDCQPGVAPVQAALGMMVDPDNPQ